MFWNFHKQPWKTVFGRVARNTPSDEPVDFLGGLETLARQFEPQKRILLSVSADTEQEFIAFGREAGALFSDSKAILELVHGVLEKVTGENAQQAVELFEALIGDAGRLIAADEEEIQSLIGEMSDLREGMGRLLDHRRTMERAVRLPLLVLKLGFRTEGAHANGEMGKALQSMALEVNVLRDKLTSAADEQFAGLEIATGAMGTLVATLCKMSEEARRQHSEGSERMEELRHHAAQLREAGFSQGEIAGRIGDNGRRLQQEFNRVVMALQYHDITRQQLEHVGAAFETMRDWLPSANPPDDSQTGSEPALFHHACSLQIQQTRSTLESLRAAGREFQAGVGAIAHYAGDLTADVSAFSDLCRNERVFQALDGLGALQAFVHARSEIKRQVGEAACEIYGKVTDCTAEVRELTVDLRLLAINAQVQAANSGQQHVIEVLAQNICQVSDVIRETTLLLTSATETIMKQISALVMRAWKLGTQQTSEGRAVAEGVPRCVAFLRDLQTGIGDGLDSANRSQTELQQRIDQLLLSVNFPELASRRLESVLAFFEEIQRETQFTAGIGDDNANHEALKDFSSSYTMAREREVHAVVTGHAAAPEVAESIELFGSEKGAPMDNEFGDNVDLF